jgi:hypothetical protein
MPTASSPDAAQDAHDNAVVPFLLDLERGLVTVDGKTYPTKPLNQPTLTRHIERRYGTDPVPLADLVATFAADDSEDAQAWTVAKLNDIRRGTITADHSLVWIRAYGPSGGGRKVGMRLAPADDPEVQDQLIDTMLRAQRYASSASARYTALAEVARKRGIAVPTPE